MGECRGVAGTLSRGDVRLCRFAPPDKQRPVLILTRDSAVGHLATVTVAPITSTIRGVPCEVVLDFDDGMKGPALSICTTRLPWPKRDWDAASPP
jgi:mRNA-degrading endonuclease toxin of MazEF toxin-antitoxin module